MYDSAVWFSRLELVSPLGNGALSLFSPPDSYSNRKPEAVGSFRSSSLCSKEMPLATSATGDSEDVLVF